MRISEKHIICDCHKQIDTSDSPTQVKCPACGRVYGKTPPKLLFMGVQEENFPAGVVII